MVIIYVTYPLCREWSYHRIRECGVRRSVGSALKTILFMVNYNNRLLSHQVICVPTGLAIHQRLARPFLVIISAWLLPPADYFHHWVWSRLHQCLWHFNVLRHTKKQIAAILFQSAPSHTRLKFQSVPIQGVKWLWCVCFNFWHHPLLWAKPSPDELCAAWAPQPFHSSQLPWEEENHSFLTGFELHCSCWLPELGEMIQCDCCKNWYHFDCMDVPENVKKAWNMA